MTQSAPGVVHMIHEGTMIDYSKNTFSGISVVMAYWNRKTLLLDTLSTFQRQYAGKYDFEVILVDDNSTPSDKITPLVISDFTFPIHVIEITSEEKGTRMNPSVVFNRGFRRASKDLIMIQNPECIHVGDLFHHALTTMQYDTYLVFPCFNSTNEQVNEFVRENIAQLSMATIEYDVAHLSDPWLLKWYHHPTRRSTNFHFCSVMTREYMTIFGGFDERYKHGLCYDDDIFLFQIQENLKLNIESPQHIGVIHLFHGRSAAVNITRNTDPRNNARYEKYVLNKSLYETTVRDDHKIIVPKLFHYYWDDFRKFTYLHLYSLRSAVHYHADYIHIIWTPTVANEEITWQEMLNTDQTQACDWQHCLRELQRIPQIRIIPTDMITFLNVPSSMAEIHKSDLFRYKILHRYGGIWSDTDIVYRQEITRLIPPNVNFETILVLCKDIPNQVIYIPIGLLMSRRRAPLFENIFQYARSRYDKSRYQCMGCEMMMSFFQIHYKSPIDWENLRITLPNYKYDQENTLWFKNRHIFFDEHFYTPLDWTNIPHLFLENTRALRLDSIVGFHWYNGSPLTREFLREISSYRIPSKFNGILFSEREKFVSEYLSIVYITTREDTYLTHELRRIGFHVQRATCASEWKSNTDTLYILDEFNKSFLAHVTQSMHRVSYHMFYTENLHSEPLDDAVHLLLQHAQRIYVCRTSDISHLIRSSISFDKIIYLPPFPPRNDAVVHADEQDIDVLIMASPVPSSSYRQQMIATVQQHISRVVIAESAAQTEGLLPRSSIVLHIPHHHEHLHAFPWAETTELMLRRVFFVTQENEDMYIQGLESVVAHYNTTNNLTQVLQHYLENPSDRAQRVEACYRMYTERFKIENYYSLEQQT